MKEIVHRVDALVGQNFGQLGPNSLHELNGGGRFQHLKDGSKVSPQRSAKLDWQWMNVDSGADLPRIWLDAESCVLNAECLFLRFPVSKQARVNLLQSFIAVVAGNAVYFLLMPYLPPAARHDPAKPDIGVLVDFWFCLVFLGLIKTLARKKPSSHEEHREK